MYVFVSSGQGGGGGSCPYVFSWEGNELTPENNILPQTEYPANKGADVTDYYRLLRPPNSNNGRYQLRVGEFEGELSHIDQVQLLAVDHQSWNHVAVLSDGEIVEYAMPYTIAGAGSQYGERNYTGLVKTMEGAVLYRNPGDSLILTFRELSTDSAGLPENAEGGLLLGGWVVRGKQFESPAPPPKEMSVGGLKGNGGLTGDFTFRERSTLVYVPLKELQTQITLRFTKSVAIDYADLVTKIPSDHKSQELNLLSAVHSSNGVITGELSRTDGFYSKLRPGESIELEYLAPPQEPNTVRDFILVSRGRYEHLTSIQPEIPQAFSLDQNYPNPFNPWTTLSYQLASPGRVSLALYNVLGQQIAQLVDEVQEAGYYERVWDGSKTSSGIYYARLVATDNEGKQVYQSMKKLLLLK